MTDCYYNDYDYIDYNNCYDDSESYYEESDADFKLLGAIEFAADKIGKFFKKKATKYVLEQIVPPGSTIVIYNNDTKLELMCRPVDNTKMSYEEFRKNWINQKFQFEIDVDHIINQNTAGGKVEAFLKDIFEL